MRLAQQQVEIAIAGRQHDDVGTGGGFDHIQGDAHIPVAFGGAVAALDVRLQLHLKTNGAQDILELFLLFVAAPDSVGTRLHHLPPGSRLRPKTVVVKAAPVGVAGGVVDVLHIHKQADPLHRLTLMA